MRRLGIVIGAGVAIVALILIVTIAQFDVNHYRTQIQTEMEQRHGNADHDSSPSPQAPVERLSLPHEPRHWIPDRDREDDDGAQDLAIAIVVIHEGW